MTLPHHVRIIANSGQERPEHGAPFPVQTLSTMQSQTLRPAGREGSGLVAQDGRKKGTVLSVARQSDLVSRPIGPRFDNNIG